MVWPRGFTTLLSEACLARRQCESIVGEKRSRELILADRLEEHGLLFFADKIRNDEAVPARTVISTGS